MAQEIIAGPLTALVGKAIGMAAERFGLMPGFTDDLGTMEVLVREIESRVTDAVRQSGNPVVLRWLKEFEGATLEAEIVLDELLYEGLRRKVHENNSGEGAKVRSFLSSIKHAISFRYRMSYKVRGINVMLKGINKRAQNLELALLGRDIVAERETASLIEQFVAGRSREESEIVDMLLSVSSDDNNPSVSVLPIVGMGGIGKTTLAKSIYNNGKIVNHFTKKCWVCVFVDRKFEVTAILKRILESLKEGGIKVDMSSRDAIVCEIQKELSGERFLFVLDDVWNEDLRLWDRFSNSLVGLSSANGSCCVVTTRLQTTANLVCTPSFKPFYLGKLSDDDCWHIIGRKATRGGKMPAEFEVHKEEIAKICQGLPLAANAIGGLLSSKLREDWISVVEEKILKVSESVKGDILPILKLSFDNLPFRSIKKCFVYCSVYPKYTTLDGKKLIELWMAEGFLQEGSKGRTMEEVGIEYLNILLQSSLLDQTGYTGKHQLCQMHDLLHDLAECISNEEHHDGDRHRILAVGGKELKCLWNQNSALIQFEEGDVSDEMILKCRNARMIHFSSKEIKILPKVIGKLKHVRCLTLSLGGIKSLPESLCKLYNLLILRLNDCEALQSLPQGLSNLISLRHFHFFCPAKEFKTPPNMGRLTCLQTFPFFHVGEKKGHKIEELGFMKNLTGKLIIRNLELVKGKEEATSAKLDAKGGMIELEFEWGSTTRRSSDNCDEQVLEGLEPCMGLRELIITNFIGFRFPRWLGELSALVSLRLNDCKNITELGYSGDSGFPNLKTLHISGCCQLSSALTSFPILEKLEVRNILVSAVRDIISTTNNSLKVLRLFGVCGMRRLSDVTESSLSSCLKKLVIVCCEDLLDIQSSTLECCTCLESLKVDGCPKLVSCPLNLPQIPSLSVIELVSCPKLFTADAIPRGFEHLTNFKELWIGSDNSVQSMDWDGLRKGCSTTLQRLTMEMSSGTQLPQQLEDFSSLVWLTISRFDSLECLPDWLGKLTSLQRLHLSCCPKLEHLPTDAMRNLINLQVLDIQVCPLLRTQGDEITALPGLQVNWPDY